MQCRVRVCVHLCVIHNYNVAMTEPVGIIRCRSIFFEFNKSLHALTCSWFKLGINCRLQLLVGATLLHTSSLCDKASEWTSNVLDIIVFPAVLGCQKRDSAVCVASVSHTCNWSKRTPVRTPIAYGGLCVALACRAVASGWRGPCLCLRQVTEISLCLTEQTWFFGRKSKHGVFP